VATAGPLEIVSSRAGHLWDALCRAYDTLGFDDAAGGDAVFRQVVLARIIEPTSKLDSLRVLTEAGIVPTVAYRTLDRRHAGSAEPDLAQPQCRFLNVTKRQAGIHGGDERVQNSVWPDLLVDADASDDASGPLFGRGVDPRGGRRDRG
jgi:hypothetical protein